MVAANQLSHRFGFGCARQENAALVDDPVCQQLRLTEAWLTETDQRASMLFDAARQVIAAPAAV